MYLHTDEQTALLLWTIGLNEFTLSHCGEAATYRVFEDFLKQEEKLLLHSQFKIGAGNLLHRRSSRSN